MGRVFTLQVRDSNKDNMIGGKKESIMLYYNRSFPCTVATLCHKDTEKGKKEVPHVGCFRCLGMCLYGIIELVQQVATTTASTDLDQWEWSTLNIRYLTSL